MVIHQQKNHLCFITCSFCLETKKYCIKGQNTSTQILFLIRREKKSDVYLRFVGKLWRSPHFAQHGAYSTWKQCSQYFLSSNS